MSSNDDKFGKDRNKAQLISLKQPSAKSSGAVLNAVKKLFQLVRQRQALSIVVVIVWKQDLYINAVVPEDNTIIEDTMDALTTARERVSKVGLLPR